MSSRSHPHDRRPIRLFLALLLVTAAVGAEPFVIHLDAGDPPPSATQRPYRFTWGGTVREADLVDLDAMTAIYDDLVLDLRRVWAASPTEPIPHRDGRTWATTPVVLELAGAVDYLLVGELARLILEGFNPIRPHPGEVNGFRDLIIRHGETEFRFPVAVARSDDQVPSASINLVIHPPPRWLPTAMPSELEVSWRAAPTLAAVMHLGKTAPEIELDPVLLPAGAVVAEDYLNLLRDGLARQLVPHAISSDPVVIHCFGLLPWHYAVLAHDLLAEISPGREIRFAPSRWRYGCRWPNGNEIWELVHTRNLDPAVEEERVEIRR